MGSLGAAGKLRTPQVWEAGLGRGEALCWPFQGRRLPPGGHQCVAPLVFLYCGNPGAIILNLQSSQENLPKETSEGFGPENIWVVR